MTGAEKNGGRTFPRCVHCGKRVWFDSYGPGWVHFRGTVWCAESLGLFAEVGVEG
jgi:hypothetical protein